MTKKPAKPGVIPRGKVGELLPGEWLTGDEIRIGDHITHYMYLRTGTVSHCWSNLGAIVVQSIAPKTDGNLDEDNLWFSLGQFEIGRVLYNAWWYVTKRGTAVKSGEFPSKCLFCGQAAYVGLFEVRHQNPNSCPDRK